MTASSQVRAIRLESFASLVGSEFAEIVADGNSTLLTCSTAVRLNQPFRWIWCRVESFNQCGAPREVGVVDQSLDRTFYAASTTGVYYCVAKDDNQTVFDEYYQLSTGKQQQKVIPSYRHLCGPPRATCCHISSLA